MKVSYVVIEKTYYLENEIVVIFVLKMNFIMISTYLTNNTANQTPYNSCKIVEEAKKVIRTPSRRIVKIPSRYDD